MMANILRRTSLVGVLVILSATLTASPASAAEPGPVWISPVVGQPVTIENGLTLQVEPVVGETYRPPGSAGPYLFGLFKVEADGSSTPIYENWANEQRLDGPTWTLAPGSPGWKVLAQQQAGVTLQLWVRAYMGNEATQHWSEASIINVQYVPFFIIGNPPGTGPIDPLNITIGEYLIYLQNFYDGLSDAVTAVDCGSPSADPLDKAMDCVSLIWHETPEPAKTVLDTAWDVIGCRVGIATDPENALRQCIAAGASGMELIVYVLHQVLLNTGDPGRWVLDQKLLPQG
jgi:hypothetical protein